MMYEYRLTFNVPVHFGIEGIGQERIENRGRSDTLWGAIIQQWLHLYPEEDPERLCLDTPFLVSSCFPVIKGVSFYPLPLGSIDYLFTGSAGINGQGFALKDLKKIRFVSKEIFFDLIQGKRINVLDIRQDTVFPFPGSSSSITDGQPVPFFSVLQRPRLRINQLSGGPSEGAFFYCSDQYFNTEDKSGLFFLASFKVDGARQRFESALRLLGDTGLGGDRSVGRGTFTVSGGVECSFPTQPAKSSHLLLSLFHPTEEEVRQGILKGTETAFSLIRRFGHAAAPGVSSSRRGDVWMLEEGAVLLTEPEGDVTCVLSRSEKIAHNVYRCGRAFSIPVKFHVEPTGKAP